MNEQIFWVVVVLYLWVGLLIGARLRIPDEDGEIGDIRPPTFAEAMFVMVFWVAAAPELFEKRENADQ